MGKSSVSLRFLDAWVPLGLALSGVGPMLSNDVSVRLSNENCQKGRVFQVKVAQDQAAREQGLSGRLTPLGPREGMLFLFEEPASQTFWMKDTWIPLRLFMIDSKGHIVENITMRIEDDPTQPESRYASSSSDIVAALEVSVDFVLGAEKGETHLCVQTPDQLN